LDLIWIAFGNLGAEIQHGNFVRDSHHQLHIVLNKNDGDAAITNAGYHGVEFLRFMGVQPGRRFVEQ
jgi:hypothetical protein